jgi:hypothetical protein
MAAENSSCGCVGDTLTFSCTVSGGSSTVWQGTAFGNCRIILLHSQFVLESGTHGSCNHGSMVAQSEHYSINHSTNTSYYTSYLRVVATPDLNNTNIQCLLYINSGLLQLESYNISIISGILASNAYENFNDNNTIVDRYSIYAQFTSLRIYTFTANRYLLVWCKLYSHFVCMDSTCFTLSTLHFLCLYV